MLPGKKGNDRWRFGTNKEGERRRSLSSAASLRWHPSARARLGAALFSVGFLRRYWGAGAAVEAGINAGAA